MANMFHTCLLVVFKIEALTFAFEVPDKARENYYGMGVEDAWAKGYTGEGVVVGIAGVGVDTELADLKDNINKDLSFNFVRNSSDVTAEQFHDRPDSFRETNYGNSVASIIGAIKDNSICSAGIAFRSSLVVLKVFEYNLTGELEMFPKQWTKSDVTTRALVHRLDDIDILVLTMSPNMPFQRIDSSIKKAVSKGFKLGRKGLGRIYVVSAGAIGNEVTNNVNTITVNGMGRYGTIPFQANRDTSVLTAGLSNGNNLTSEYMFTTSFDDDCTVRFSGVAAATSQVAAIIALALQANPKLSAHSIQHLIVQSSQVSDVEEADNFRQNGAGKYYHPYFGFGLLNATTFVELARLQNKSLNPLSAQLEMLETCSPEEETALRYKFCHDCNHANDLSCITDVEYLAIVIDIKTHAKYLNMSVTSPSRTNSSLLENTEVLNGRVFGKLISANFWDELSFGKWELKISSNGGLHAEKANVSMEMYGTNKKHYFIRKRNCFGTSNVKSSPKNDEPTHNPSELSIEFRYLIVFLYFVILGLLVWLAWCIR